MGKCTYSKKWEESYPWIQPISGDSHSAKCITCKKTISITGGTQNLDRHADRPAHKAKAVDLTLPSIQSLITTQLVEDGKRNALFFHCLKLVLNGWSLRSSDSASKSRQITQLCFLTNFQKLTAVVQERDTLFDLPSRHVSWKR